MTVELSGNGDAYATVDLPLTPYGMLDTLEKLRMTPQDKPDWDICSFHQHKELYQWVGSGSVYELNALAAKLSEMDDWASTAFEGLVQAQKDKGLKIIPMDTLIDFAYGAHDCHIVDEAHTDAELGRFLVDGGFIPETEDVPDNALEMLDYAKIGRDWRQGESGAFTKGGYVMPVVMGEAHKNMDFTPQKPVYTALMELTAADSSQSTTLALPASPAEMDATLDRIGATKWNEVSCRCLDCRVPTLRDMITDAGNIAHANRAAEYLDRLPEADLPKYKALLVAMEVTELHEALDLTQRLDEYILSPEQTNYEDIARGELRLILGEKEVETLLPCVNLYQYGKALQEKYELVLTDYGSVERRDNQPLMEPQERSQPTMGMEMTQL